MDRTGSIGQPQAASCGNTSREVAGQESEESAYKTTAGRTTAPPTGRKTSATAVAQLQSRYVPRASPRPAKLDLHRRSMSPLASTSRPSTATNGNPSAASPSSTVSSDGDESSSDSNLPMQSRLLRRPPRRPRSSDDEEEVADAPTFLPFTDPGRAAPWKQTSVATLRDSPGQIARNRSSNEKIRNSQTSDSSASSTTQHHPVSHRDPKHPRAVNAGTGMPPVPRRTAELVSRSQQSTGNGQTPRRESDGAPSMGSSFSDLDGEQTKVDVPTLSTANIT